MWGRKHRPPRRGVHADAWITQDGDFAARKCTVLDISPNGAKIRCEDQQFLRDTFRLKYARESRTGRLCKVVWRNGKQVGVAFRD